MSLKLWNFQEKSTKNLLTKLFFVVAILFASTTTDSTIVDEVQEQIECLAQNIYFEARGEPHSGKIAVGMVTMNRVKSKWYPNSVCEVVTQKIKKTCQFSWVCMPQLPRIREEVYNEIRTLAERVYNGTVKDPTKGATNFHAVTIEPIWASTKQVTAQIGNHIFYKRK